MKIQVKTGDTNISIPIPTGLLFSKPTVWLFLKFSRKASIRYIPEGVEDKADIFLSKLPDEAVYAMCEEIMRVKRKYGSWDLVEVESSSGEQVLIRL